MIFYWYILRNFGENVDFSKNDPFWANEPGPKPQTIWEPNMYMYFFTQRDYLNWNEHKFKKVPPSNIAFIWQICLECYAIQFWATCCNVACITLLCFWLKPTNCFSRIKLEVTEFERFCLVLTRWARFTLTLFTFEFFLWMFFKMEILLECWF